MATYTNHSQRTHVDGHVDGIDGGNPGQERESTSPVLLGALAMALLAGGITWYAQRDDAATVPVAPTVTLVEPPAATATATAPARPSASARTAERSRPVAADRAPQPLAGNPLPEYPRSALRAGEEATVMLRIAVDTHGVPTDVQVVQRSGARDRSFDRAAIDAARQWRSEPAIRDGKAVPAAVQLPVQSRRG